MSRTTFTSSVLPPHERGIELGRHFSREVAHTVATYRTLFETRATGPHADGLAGHPVEQVVGALALAEHADRAWTAIQRLAPVHAEEIAGIAEGAGLALVGDASRGSGGGHGDIFPRRGRAVR